MEIRPHIFREYDIRGIADTRRDDCDLTEPVVERIGMAFATYLRNKKTHNAVCIGRDGRLTSKALAQAAIDGLAACGVNIIDLGQIPTPLLYFGLFKLPVDGGIMITGSHNPQEYNGMKVAVGDATIHGAEIQKLGRLAIEGAFARTNKPVTIARMDIAPRYVRRILSGIELRRKLRIVVDAGNGVGGVVAVPLFERLGCEVIPLYCEVDGNFPHHHPDPTLRKSLAALVRTVRKYKADCGIAFDGDADRLGGVDDTGEILWGDKLLTLFARAVLREKPGATIIGEVKCSRTLYDDIAKHGGKPRMWKTGHSLIKAAMKQFRAQLAGEMSGHMFFKHRWYGFDDAIYSAARLFEFLSAGTKTLHEHLADIPKTYVTEELRIQSGEDRKFEIVAEATRYFQEELGLDVNTIDGARIEFPDGWGLVRASNTSPVLVMRCEAETPKRLKEIRKLVEDKVNDLNK